MLTLIALIGAHCFFDFAGQGDFMARAKNPAAALEGVPWRVVLMAHAAIHGAAVALITGIWWLFVLEYLAHYAVDKLKCDGDLTFGEDQAIHVACKIVWWIIAVALA